MKKGLIIAFLLLSQILSGCQLAKEEEGRQKTQDRLVGVFVSEEHLDLFDFEAYINDHAEDFFGGGNVTIENTGGYEQRIYANMENGGCEFEDLNGILFASYAFDEGHVKGYRNAPGNAVSDGHVNWTEGEKEVSLKMDGTIYVSDKIGFVSYFYNPVYQDAEGNVYLTAGTGTSTNVEEGQRMQMWHTLDDKFTETNGKSSFTYSADIRIGVTSVPLPEEYVLISMDENHQELGREVYLPTELPVEIFPAEGAAYLLAESRTTRLDGTEMVTRTIHSRTVETQTLDVFTPLEGYVCAKSTSVIKW